MKLSDFPENYRNQVICDGEFESVGMLYQRKSNSLSVLSSKSHLTELKNNKSISCIITTKELSQSIPSGIGIYISTNPVKSFYELHEYLLKTTEFYGHNFKSQIDKTCIISKFSDISDTNVTLGKNVEIGSFSSILGRTSIGCNSKISNNVSIGSDGFEVKNLGDKAKVISHAGKVHIGENVEIHSFSTVDRGLFDDQTTIGDNVKIDAFVHVAHNVTIEENTVVTAGVTFAGSAHIGKNVYISPGAIINNKVHIGDGSLVGLGEIVIQNIPSNSAIFNKKIVPRHVYDRARRIVKRDSRSLPSI